MAGKVLAVTAFAVARVLALHTYADLSVGQADTMLAVPIHFALRSGEKQAELGVIDVNLDGTPSEEHEPEQPPHVPPP